MLDPHWPTCKYGPHLRKKLFGKCKKVPKRDIRVKISTVFLGEKNKLIPNNRRPSKCGHMGLAHHWSWKRQYLDELTFRIDRILLMSTSISKVVGLCHFLSPRLIWIDFLTVFPTQFMCSYKAALVYYSFSSQTEYYMCIITRWDTLCRCPLSGLFWFSRQRILLTRQRSLLMFTKNQADLRCLAHQNKLDNGQRHRVSHPVLCVERFILKNWAHLCIWIALYLLFMTTKVP